MNESITTYPSLCEGVLAKVAFPHGAVDDPLPRVGGMCCSSAKDTTAVGPAELELQRGLADRKDTTDS